MKILTEADSFDSSLTVPEGGDPRTATSVEGPLQALANRTRFMHSRMAAAIFALTGAAYLDDDDVGLTLVGQYSSGFALVGNRITLPAAGAYMITLRAGMTVPSATANQDHSLTASVVGLSGVLVSATARRHTTSTSEVLELVSAGPVVITTPSTQVVRLSAATGVGFTILNRLDTRLVIQRMW